MPTDKWNNGFQPKGIVLHDDASPIGFDTAKYFQTTTREASAHFCLGRTGQLDQCVDLDKRAWHAGPSRYKGVSDVNDFAFGIEINNPGKLKDIGGNRYKHWSKREYSSTEYDIKFEQTEAHGPGYWMDYTIQQMEAVTDLCQVLVEAFNLEFITTHWEISPGRKIDTNPLFPLEHVRSRVFGRNSTPEPFPYDAVTVVNSNMRRWPSTISEIIQVVPRGSGVDLIRFGEFDGNRWYLVRYEDQEGWIYGSLLDVD
ncbi:MAG: N-acetylmuramoyl-L-alanine amidase [Pseudohongiellaceae bacterium]